MREYYVRTQSMGERCDSRWLTLTNNHGKGIKITPEGTIDFSAQHYTDRELWQVKYAHEPWKYPPFRSCIKSGLCTTRIGQCQLRTRSTSEV